MKLNSKSELIETKGNWLNTYNTVLIVLFIGIFVIFGIRVDFGSAFLFAVFIAGGGFLLKQKIAKSLCWGICNYEFSLDKPVTPEALYQKIAAPLLGEGIEAKLKDGTLQFIGKYADYELVYQEASTNFKLHWSGKTLFSLKFITLYRELLEETGVIAFLIQQ